jgi:hypothetical protein
VDKLERWYEDSVSKDFPKMRARTLALLQEEAELNEIVQLVGVDSLSFEDRMKLEVCKSIREDYLHQNAFHDIDTYTSMNKQYKLLKLILAYYDMGLDGIKRGAPLTKIMNLPEREDIGRFKYIEEKSIDLAFDDIHILLRTHQHIDPSVRCPPLYLHLQPDQLEQDVHHVLEMRLRCHLGIILIVRKERLQSLHKPFRIAFTYIIYELRYLGFGTILLNRTIVRQQEAEEPFVHFLVRECQPCQLLLSIAAHYRQIPALV